MDTRQIIREIDQQIMRLQQARKLLAGPDSTPTPDRSAQPAVEPVAHNHQTNKLTSKQRSERMKAAWAKRKAQMAASK